MRKINTVLVLSILITPFALAETCPDPGMVHFDMSGSKPKWLANGWEQLTQYPPLYLNSQLEREIGQPKFSRAVWNLGGAMVYHTGIQCDYLVDIGRTKYRFTLGSPSTMYATVEGYPNWTESTHRYRTCTASVGGCQFANH